MSKINLSQTPITNNILEYLNFLPLYISHVQAGFPSPADDYIEGRLSLNDLVSIGAQNATSIYIVRARGDSMINIGIRDNTYLIVDRSLTPVNNDIVIASVNSDFTVKRYKKLPTGKVILCPENPKYEILELTEDFENIFWGVVTGFYQRLK